MSSMAVKVTDDGGVVIPQQFRQTLGLQVGDVLVIELVGGGLRISSPSAAVRSAQEIVRSFVPSGARLADKLIAEAAGD